MRVKWKLVLVLLKIVLISVKDWCRVCTIVLYAQKSFWAHQMELLGDVGEVEARFSLLEIVLIWKQDRFTLCAERAIGSEISWDGPDCTAR